MEDSATWVIVAASNRLQEGEAIEVLFGDDVVAIWRSGGELYALDGLCAHQGGPLARGVVAGGCVTCPWHGWRYRLADGCNDATGKPMVRPFEAREEAGNILLRRKM
jgi:nitrite reductase/ring-hydroxylating ferredoxin subunit